jgi:molybdopterin/thiamine biosynthesis adenylyltransferase
MKRVLTASADTWNRLLIHLTGTTAERMAFGYCSLITSDAVQRFVLHELALPNDREYSVQHSAGVRLGAVDAVPYLIRARGAGAFLDVHAHPSCVDPRPSRTDDEAAGRQLEALQGPAPGSALVRMIVSADTRIWAAVHSRVADRPGRVSEVQVHGPRGGELIIPTNSERRECSAREIDSRTLACLGETRLSLTRSLTVGVIGVGGVGSMVARLLAGVVGQLILVDPDKLEPHNVPRLWFAGWRNRGSKALAARRSLQRSFPELKVQASTTAFPSAAATRALNRADSLFVCPDSNTVRWAASRFAAERLMPMVEVGCGGRARSGVLSALGYHVRLQVPGGPCLACNGLDLSKLEDPSTTAAKKKAGYIEDTDEIPGELACLTTRAAADAVDVFLRYWTGYAGRAPVHLYGDSLRLKTLDLSVNYSSRIDCPVCGSSAGELCRQAPVILRKPLRL